MRSWYDRAARAGWGVIAALVLIGPTASARAQGCVDCGYGYGGYTMGHYGTWGVGMGPAAGGVSFVGSGLPYPGAGTTLVRYGAGYAGLAAGPGSPAWGGPVIGPGGYPLPSGTPGPFGYPRNDFPWSGGPISGIGLPSYALPPTGSAFGLGSGYAGYGGYRGY